MCDTFTRILKLKNTRRTEILTFWESIKNICSFQRMQIITNGISRSCGHRDSAWREQFLIPLPFYNLVFTIVIYEAESKITRTSVNGVLSITICRTTRTTTWDFFVIRLDPNTRKSNKTIPVEFSIFLTHFLKTFRAQLISGLFSRKLNSFKKAWEILVKSLTVAHI